MKGAMVFSLVFIALVMITLGNVNLPPGILIHRMLNPPETNYPILGIPATSLSDTVWGSNLNPKPKVI